VTAEAIFVKQISHSQLPLHNTQPLCKRTQPALAKQQGICGEEQRK